MTSKLKKWIAGGIASVTGVVAYIISNPMSFGGAFANVMIADPMSMFTAFSILGYTVAPEIPSLPAGAFKALAILFGVIAVVKILDSIWESLKRRLMG